MAYVQIPNLPAVARLSGQELFEGVQSGTSVKISLDQVIAAARAGTPTTLPLSVAVGGTGVSTITGYVKGSGTSPFTGSSTIPNTDITGLGTMSTQNANAVAITGGSITGITDLAVADGGTGQGAALTQYGIIYGGSATAMASTAAGTSTQVLHGNASGAPTWGSVSLTADVSGVLPVANGGTNISSYTIGDILFASATGILSRLADVATGNAIISGGVGTAPSYGKIGLTTHISGVLPVANGGTNISSYAVGDILYASASGVLSPLADIATGNVLLSGGVTTAPSYGKVGLTTHVSGILPLANGGTGINAVSTAAVYAALLGYTSTATATGTTVLTNTSTQYQLFTGTLGQTITLPVTSTLTTGWTFHIVNNSTGNLTVNSSGGNLVATVIPQTTAMVTCIATTTTTAADWEFGFTDFGSVTGTGSVVLGTAPTITAGVYSGTVGASNPSTGAFTTVTASTSVLSSGTGGVGYSTGAGVAVTQLTSRTTTTPTTGASKSGAVTLFTTTAVVGTYFSFTVPNTGIAVTDTVVVSVRGATNTYVAFVSAITAATSFQVTMASVAGVASDTPIVNFTIIKGVSA